MSDFKKDTQTKALKDQADQLAAGIDILIDRSRKSINSDTEEFVSYLNDAMSNIEDAVMALCLSNTNVSAGQN